MNYHELYQFGTFELRRNIKHFTKQLNDQVKKKPKNARCNPITVNDLFKLKWIAHPVITHVHSVLEPNSHVLFKSYHHQDHNASQKSHHHDPPLAAHNNSPKKDIASDGGAAKDHNPSGKDPSGASSDSSSGSSGSGSYYESDESLSVSEEGNKPSHLQIVLTGILPSKDKIVLTFFLEPKLQTTNIHLLPKPWYIILGEMVRC